MATPPSPEPTMKIDPLRASTLSSNLTHTLSAISAATPKARTRPVRLVAVSKLKPASDILALVSPPPQQPSSNPQPPSPLHLHFGENYVQELQSKAASLPRSVKWHFIGALQSNKCRPLAKSVENLWAVESVDSVKKADGLERGRASCVERLRKERDSDQGPGQGQGQESSSTNGDQAADDDEVEKLRVFIQVNTSSEPQKAGVEPGSSSALELVRHIETSCPHLRVQGLMTIGALGNSTAPPSLGGEANSDFVTLKRERGRICGEMGWEEDRLELSMGMSADFEEAIGLGSDEVRVGTGIFGERPPKGGAKDGNQEGVEGKG